MLEGLERRDLLAVDVLTYRYDNAGQGANLQETSLSPSNVVPGQAFGKLFGITLDGLVYAQPLVKTGVAIANGPNTVAGAAGTHDVVFVCTEHDTVYAIDTNVTSPIRILWQRSFLDATNPNNALPGTTSMTTLPSQFDVTPQIGITSTPVIDASTNLMYVETTTVETVAGVAHYVQRLHALNIFDGTDAVTPYLIGDSIDSKTSNTQIYVYGNSGSDTVIDPYNGTGKTVIQFNALQHLQRCDLSLENGTLYIAWASHNDATPYHGWIVSWDVSHLASNGFQLNGVFNDSPNGGQAGIWEGGGTLAWESDGSAFYVETGNGLFNKGVTALDANGFPIDGNYYNALLKIVPDSSTQTTQNINGWGMHVADYFIPYNSQALDTTDQDFGSGGSMILPDSAGIPGHQHLMVAAGKEGKIYLVDRDNMGKFDPNNDHVLNAVPDGSGHNTPPVLIGGSLSTPAYYNGKIYWVSGYSNVAKTFTIGSDGTLTATSQTTATFGGLPGSPVISASGSTNGIVWLLDRNSSVLRAYDAGSFATELWDSGQKVGGGDATGALTKFLPPIVANGEVFVGTQTGLVVYGNQPPANSAPAAPSLSATPLSNSSISLFWSDPSVAPNLATGYSIESSTDNVSFAPLTTAPGGSATISIGGLLPQTTYYFRIRGFNGIGNSAYSNVATAATSSQIPALDFSTGFAGVSPSILTLNGSTTIAGSRLRLTSGLTNQVGTSFSTNRIDITKFSTQFTFNLSAGPNTADGFTFLVQGVGPTSLGAGGGGLGYSGIGKSVAVKFGTSSTTGVGPNATGEYITGHSPNTNSIDLTPSGIDLHSGDVFLVSMSYDGTALAVSIKDTITGAVATQSYTVSIPQIVGGTSAYVGFTGSTGALTSTQDILAWTFTPGTVAAPAAPSALGAVPTTSTSITLNWTNNATNQSGFQLDRANDYNFTQGLLTLTLPASPNSYIDTATGIAPGSTFFYRIRATNNAGPSANSNVASVTIPVPPLTPTSAHVTSVTTSEIDLTWTDNAGRSATGYLIQRRVGTGNFADYATLPAMNYVPPATPPAPYDWSDVNVAPGTTYEYHVIAYNTSGNIDFTGTNAETLTLPPSSLTASSVSGGVALAWAPAAGAVAYNVYRGTAGGAETLLASGVMGLQFTDQTAIASTAYFYEVTAVNGNVAPLPSESGPSNEVSLSPLAAPSALAAVPATATSVTLNWINNATNPTGFQMDRAGDVNFTQGLVTQVLAAAPDNFTDVATGLAPGSTYFYRIRATSSAGVSPNSNVATVTIPFAPAAPTSAAVTGVTSSEIDLSWTDNAGSTATGYQIQRRIGTGNFTNYTTLPASAASPPSAYTWSDLSVTAGTVYEYQVISFNTSGSSNFADAGAITLTLPPTGLFANGSTNSIGLTWSAATGAASYNIYRGTVAGGETLLTSGVTATTFTDQSAIANTTYFYMVTAVNGNAAPLPNESGPTNEASASLTQNALAASYSSNPPTIWYTGLAQSYSITVTNIGTTTWTPTGTNPFHLGVYFAAASDAVGAWPAEPQRFNIPSNVAPGQSVTVTVKPTPPLTGGAYVLRARMVEEGVAWFATLQKTNVVVNTLAANYVASPPLTWTPGQTITYSITVTNSGDSTWSASGANAVHLGSYFGGTSDAVKAWTVEPHRTVLPADVAPGGSATLTVTLKAPSAPGNYVLRQRMVMENVAWFSTMVRANVTVGSNTGTLIPPTVYLATATGAPPTSLKAGSSLSFSLSLTNAGADIWKALGTTAVRAVVYLTPSSAAPPGTTATPAQSLNLTSDVAVGGATTLGIRFTTPTAKGKYVLRVRLLGADGSTSDFILPTKLQLL